MSRGRDGSGAEVSEYPFAACVLSVLVVSDWHTDSVGSIM